MSENKTLIHHVLKCFQCGVCTGSCPVSSITSFNPRKIAYKIVRGIWEVDEIWYCLTCHICEARCPNCIRFAEVIMRLREENIKRRGDILDVYREMLKQFLDSGLAIGPISSDVEKYREKLRQNLNREEFRELLMEILRRTGFKGI
jgi:heterodisulfide reductase subunit C